MKSFRDDCLLIENSLALWVGGDLEAELCDRIDRHLSQCERCDVLARSLVESRQALISGLRVDVDRAPDLWPGIQSALRTEGRLSAWPTEERSTAGRAVVAAAKPSIANPLRALPAAPSRGRGLRVAGRVGLAAAAAVIVGFMLGRLGSEAPIDTGGAPPVVHLNPPESKVPGTLTNAQPTVAVPVSDHARLRRLAPGESPLAETAQNFATEWYSLPSPFGSSNVGSPASLHSVQPRR